MAAACGGTGQAGEAAPAPVEVEAVVAVRDTIRSAVRSVGSLEADALVEVRAELDGRISRVLFREGQPVAAGEVLLLIDRATLAAEVERAAAAVERAEAEAANAARQLQRSEGLVEAGAISPQALDDLRAAEQAARARLSEARAALAVARRHLEDATVRAPFAGRAGERRVDVGDFVSRGDPLLTLVDDDSLEIAFSVPERYVTRLQAGSPVRLAVASHPDRTFQGEVDFVSPVVDPETRTVRVKARLANPDSELRAGQFASVEMGLEVRADAVVVPEAAIVPRGGEAFVFVVEGGEARQRPVRVGERSPGLAEILSGVSPGDTVIVAGQQKIGEGARVAPTLLPLREAVETGAAGEATGGGAVPPPDEPRPDAGGR